MARGYGFCNTVVEIVKFYIELSAEFLEKVAPVAPSIAPFYSSCGCFSLMTSADLFMVTRRLAPTFLPLLTVILVVPTPPAPALDAAFSFFSPSRI